MSITLRNSSVASGGTVTVTNTTGPPGIATDRQKDSTEPLLCDTCHYYEV